MVTTTKPKTSAELAQQDDYAIKGLKTFTGMEGCGGFNVTLYRQGKKVAFVINEDNGGMFLWQWEGKAEVEENRLMALVKELPPLPSEYNKDGIPMDIDLFIGDLVRIKEDDDLYRRKCKTHTVYTLKSGKEGEYYQIKGVFTQRIEDYIKKEHGDDLKEIFNYRYGGKVDEKTAEDAHYRKECRTKTLFIVKGMGTRVINTPFTPELKARMQKKYGDKLVEFINERY